MNTASLELSVAPMEGLTTRVYRRVFHRLFGAADSYYIPFVTPTMEPKFTDRQLREILPENNDGLPVIPQLISNRSADFNWAAAALEDMGYTEVNLNLGCPAGTVVAKNKGSGAFKDMFRLQMFLDEIFKPQRSIKISIKTRIGWSNPDEFLNIADLYNHYPISRLIIHPRLRTDQYRGDVRMDVFDTYYPSFKFPVGYNGDLVTVNDMQTLCQKYPNCAMLMIGRGLMADPALFRKFRGGKPATKEEIFAFSESLFTDYTQAFGSRKNAIMRMKEFWFYQLNLFEEDTKLSKQIFKAKSDTDFDAAVQAVFDHLDILPEARFGWKKPA